jgi:hypothetical protein
VEIRTKKWSKNPHCDWSTHSWLSRTDFVSSTQPRSTGGVDLHAAHLTVCISVFFYVVALLICSTSGVLGVSAEYAKPGYITVNVPQSLVDECFILTAVEYVTLRQFRIFILILSGVSTSLQNIQGRQSRALLGSQTWGFAMLKITRWPMAWSSTTGRARSKHSSLLVC